VQQTGDVDQELETASSRQKATLYLPPVANTLPIIHHLDRHPSLSTFYCTGVDNEKGKDMTGLCTTNRDTEE